MRAWWTKVRSSPGALIGAGFSGGLVVAAVVALVVFGLDSDEATSSSADAAKPDQSMLQPDTSDPEANGDDSAAEILPPDPDVYCPAFFAIRSGGIAPGTDDESDQVDLKALKVTFDDLLKKYRAAERVSPLGLRDDYAQALVYLRQGRRAVASNDVNLLKALVANLDSLNASMSSIETKSIALCE